MCNACGFLCCGSDAFGECGCDHCANSACWTVCPHCNVQGCGGECGSDDWDCPDDAEAALADFDRNGGVTLDDLKAELSQERKP